MILNTFQLIFSHFSKYFSEHKIKKNPDLPAPVTGPHGTAAHTTNQTTLVKTAHNKKPHQRMRPICNGTPSLHGWAGLWRRSSCIDCLRNSFWAPFPQKSTNNRAFLGFSPFIQIVYFYSYLITQETSICKQGQRWIQSYYIKVRFWKCLCC